jgi:hypothetical protein
MKTPAGKECSYFFGDYHRGRNIEECRLLLKNPDSPPWKPSLCQTCPVPDIERQNACPNLVLDGENKKGFLGFGGGVKVGGWCSKYFLDVDDPTVGCGHCHEFRGPSIFDLLEEDSDN